MIFERRDERDFKVVPLQKRHLPNPNSLKVALRASRFKKSKKIRQRKHRKIESLDRLAQKYQAIQVKEVNKTKALSIEPYEDDLEYALLGLEQKKNVAKDVLEISKNNTDTKQVPPTQALNHLHLSLEGHSTNPNNDLSNDKIAQISSIPAPPADVFTPSSNAGYGSKPHQAGTALPRHKKQAFQFNVKKVRHYFYRNFLYFLLWGTMLMSACLYAPGLPKPALKVGHYYVMPDS